MCSYETFSLRWDIRLLCPHRLAGHPEGPGDTTLAKALATGSTPTTSDGNGDINRTRDRYRSEYRSSSVSAKRLQTIQAISLLLNRSYRVAISLHRIPQTPTKTDYESAALTN
jgi:hypothetical protein